jgi:hypothetical protein
MTRSAMPAEYATSQASNTHKPAFVFTPLRTFEPVLWIAALLIASGLGHLACLVLTGADWNGPVSLRKPGLFGISAGLTAWSIAWVMTRLSPHRLDQMIASAMAGSLLLEVGLITLQQWRGVPSHFNHTTRLDATIEVIMMVMILIVTAGIVWLTLRSVRLPPMHESSAIALRGGLWLLTFSCALGILISLLGELNLAVGKPAEVWGQAGVLKFPHGAALHAIQALPFLSWLLDKLRVGHSVALVQTAVASQTLFLAQALWQTSLGRARFDVDVWGATLLGAAGLLLLVPIVAILARVVSLARRSSPDAVISARHA